MQLEKRSLGWTATWGLLSKFYIPLRAISKPRVEKRDAYPWTFLRLGNELFKCPNSRCFDLSQLCKRDSRCVLPGERSRIYYSQDLWEPIPIQDWNPLSTFTLRFQFEFSQFRTESQAGSQLIDEALSRYRSSYTYLSP